MKTCKSIACQNDVDPTLSHDYCYQCSIRSRQLFTQADQIDTAVGIGPISIKREADPHGKSPHSSGAKLDAGKVRPGLVLGGFARALWAVAEIGTSGAIKYTENGWVEVPNGEARYDDAQMRHWLKEKMGETTDLDSHQLHLAHEAWNALARLDLHLRKKEPA